MISGAANSAVDEESVGAFSALRNVGRSSKDGILGTASAPIHMATSGNLEGQIWQTLRALGTAFILISGLGAILEGKVISRGTDII